MTFCSIRKIYVCAILWIILLGSAVLAQYENDKVEIISSSDTIMIKTMVYHLKLDKLHGLAHLSNSNGIPYTSFPLDVQFDLTDQRDQARIVRFWKIKDNRITVTAGLEGMTAQEMKIICYNEAFEVQIASQLSTDGATMGAYLFRRNNSGFDISGWDQYFSPEADDYFAANPMVDLRADRDQQWVFAPAPLNLSFRTFAGWFSIGLLDLPDASIYAFRHNALWLDFAWDRLRHLKMPLYQFPRTIFTFNRSPWDAIGDYSRFVLQGDKKLAGKPKRAPAWWKRPLVSTWGEQRVQQISDDHPNYTSQWVKEYVSQQQLALDSLKFNFIIEHKWALNDGEAAPSDRFKDLRLLIDWCHDQGLKVILFWKAWKVEGRALPIRMGVIDGEYLDATHPLFENYVDSCCQVLFGNGPNQLDADGLKIDRLFLTRDPSKAKYANSGAGIGFREAYRYLQTFYHLAKKYKPDALLISSAIDPHFAEVQDMVRINDDWDNKTVREKRARIIIQALPGMLIDGDAADLPADLALYHYVTSSIYGVPSIQYVTRFHNGPIRPEMRNRIVNLLKLYQLKPEGIVRWTDYGNWQIVNKEGELLAASLPGGKGVLVLEGNNQAKLLCIENSAVHILFDRHQLRSIKDESGRQIPFSDLGQGIYELRDVSLDNIYQLQLRQILTRRRR